MTDVFLCQNGPFVQHLLSFANSGAAVKSRVSLKAAFEYASTQLDPLISERIFIAHADFDLFKSLLRIFDVSGKKLEPLAGLAFTKPGKLRLFLSRSRSNTAPFRARVPRVSHLVEECRI